MDLMCTINKNLDISKVDHETYMKCAVPKMYTLVSVVCKVGYNFQAGITCLPLIIIISSTHIVAK